MEILWVLWILGLFLAYGADDGKDNSEDMKNTRKARALAYIVVTGGIMFALSLLIAAFS